MLNAIPFNQWLAAMDQTELHRLGLSDFLIAQIEQDDLDAPLGYRCQPPFYWQSSPIAERGIIPLWECGTTLWYFNPNTNAFEECSLEDIDESFHQYESFQSVLAELFLNLYEDEMELAEMRELAGKVGFQHIDRMFDEMPEPLEAYNGWRKHFPSTCS